MKKILSILLALSIACGSIMLTSCSDDEKEDDDDKRASDKGKDEDEDEDEDKDEDEESSDDEDESSEDESSEDEDESSEDESSEDEDESSEDEDDESSGEDEGGYDDFEFETLDSFSVFNIDIFGESTSWPFTMAPFCDYYGIDGSEMLAADDWDWYYDDNTEVDIYNPSADSETAIEDCYVDYVSTSEPTDVFEFTINGIGVGSSVDDINDAFGTAFTVSNGEIDLYDDEHGENYIYFEIEGGTVTEIDVYCDDDYFVSDEDDNYDDGGDSADYVGGDAVNVQNITFTVPEGFSGEAGSDYASFASDDMFSAIEIAVSDEDESIDDYPQEWFDEEMSVLADEITNVTYEVSTLGDADTLYYSAILKAEGIEMPMVFYLVFTDAEDYAFSGYAYGNDTGFMDELIASIELS